MKTKKILLILLLLLLITGCKVVKQYNNDELQKKKYQKYVKVLEKIEKSSDSIPFNIDVVYDRITEDEVRYQVIIDKTKKDFYDVEAIAIHDKQTDDVFPSIGIFEEKQNLLKNKKPSGIVLVGYIPYDGKLSDFECEIKVLVKFSDGKQTNTIYYVYEKEEKNKK